MCLRQLLTHRHPHLFSRELFRSDSQFYIISSINISVKKYYEASKTSSLLCLKVSTVPSISSAGHLVFEFPRPPLSLWPVGLFASGFIWGLHSHSWLGVVFFRSQLIYRFSLSLFSFFLFLVIYWVKTPSHLHYRIFHEVWILLIVSLRSHLTHASENCICSKLELRTRGLIRFGLDDSFFFKISLPRRWRVFSWERIQRACLLWGCGDHWPRSRDLLFQSGLQNWDGQML